MTSLTPRSNERIVSLDIIRGFALLGILLANMVFFKSPALQLQSIPGTESLLPLSQMDEWFQFLINWLVVGKFYPMFSFLFGLGAYIFYNRLVEKGLRPVPYFLRRFGFLLVLGLIHLIFIWSGDILHTYALAGFLLLYFLKAPAKTLLIWGISLISVSAVFLTGLLTLSYSLSADYLSSSTVIEQAQSDVNRAETVYSSGSYLELLGFRTANELPLILSNVFFTVPSILGLFLIGFYFGKKQLFHRSSAAAGFWKKMLLYGLGAGLPLTFMYAYLNSSYSSYPVWMAPSVGEGINYIGGPLLMLGYVAGIVLLVQHNQFTRLFFPIALVGRMALTNYLLQSIVCAFIFYGFGLQLFGTVTVSTGILLVLIIYTAQVILTFFWFLAFSQGPLENLWRRWVYR